jgi:hypothetical protein
MTFVWRSSCMMRICTKSMRPTGQTPARVDARYRQRVCRSRGKLRRVMIAGGHEGSASRMASVLMPASMPLPFSGVRILIVLIATVFSSSCGSAHCSHQMALWNSDPLPVGAGDTTRTFLFARYTIPYAPFPTSSRIS